MLGTAVRRPSDARARVPRARRGGRNAAGGPPGSRRTQFSGALRSVSPPRRGLTWPWGKNGWGLQCPLHILPPEEPSQAAAPASVEIRGRSGLPGQASTASRAQPPGPERKTTCHGFFSGPGRNTPAAGEVSSGERAGTHHYFRETLRKPASPDGPHLFSDWLTSL